ncbi:MAG: EamA family transporter, partial [Planctomycetaceae bacterium]
MSWILLSLFSAVFLGLYEIAKKESLRGNAVPVVLLLNVLTAASVYVPVILLSRLSPELLPGSLLRVDELSLGGHLMLAGKSLLAGSSWVFASFALKHLPVSIAAPIRASSPFVTILAAVLVLGERPTVWQWLGVGVVLISFYAFSLAGRREGIVFHRDRWVYCMVMATVLGAGSSLYDKFL